MAKLNPPYIEGKLPAQVGNTLAIPFEHSQTRPADLSGIKLRAKIKTVNTNKQIATVDSEDANTAEFVFDSNPLTVGQFYKIQLCYLDVDEEGYYSTVGVFKYTEQPLISLLQINAKPLMIEADFTIKDPTEPLYQIRYQLLDHNTNVIYEDSNWLSASAEESPLGYTFKSWLSTETIVRCIYKTINAYEAYGELPIASDEEPSGTSIAISENYEEGCVHISFDKSGFGKTLWRRRVGENWELLKITQRASSVIDFSVEQGVTYQYTDGVNKSNEVYADFEDSFLTDKNGRQLKIRFNPKVSSFKTTILETKTDTIGAKYPFFFRNGNTSYKEIPISGLISLLMDDNHLFVESSAQGPLTRPGTNALESSVIADLPHNLSSNNIRNEREFKLAVLDWLNNGEPKLFRSPTEGNYVVRLMNVTLQPNDTLGRMLHTFSATGYEVEEDKGGFVYELPEAVSQITE